MKIVIGVPPLIVEIDAKFKVGAALREGRGILFAWGDRVYNPAGIVITKPLWAHEQVHCSRQLQFCPALMLSLEARVLAWWQRYLDDAKFRLDEEIPAHVAEFGCMLGMVDNRASRRAAEAHVAGKMASPLYGSIISKERARRILRESRIQAMRQMVPCQTGSL